jgi:hypothetical protein
MAITVYTAHLLLYWKLKVSNQQHCHPAVGHQALSTMAVPSSAVSTAVSKLSCPSHRTDLQEHEHRL